MVLNRDTVGSHSSFVCAQVSIFVLCILAMVHLQQSCESGLQQGIVFPLPVFPGMYYYLKLGVAPHCALIHSYCANYLFSEVVG